MNTIFLQPSDVLFFRDGRPMSGSLAGHGAAWPLPNVVSAAFHAALHRAKLGVIGGGGLHTHRQGASGVYAEHAPRDRKFGSLQTVGPFPVWQRTNWYFPRPLDLLDAGLEPALSPTAGVRPEQSSLPAPLQFGVGNLRGPKKESSAKAWLSRTAFESYLGSANPGGPAGAAEQPGVDDREIFDPEQTIGIAIDPESGTAGQGVAAGQIYSAHYLRLQEGWQLGVGASAHDKDFHHPRHGSDLIVSLLEGETGRILVGGQQRHCTATRAGGPFSVLPNGCRDGFPAKDGSWLLKWILLSPAIWPAMEADEARGIHPHGGGWLPNWICPQTGQVLLKTGEVARRPGERREVWRLRVQREQPGIDARLVAAVVPKPLVVSGWSLPDEAVGEAGGAQSTHLAVPAGAVYYFQAQSAAAATALAAALNWHGADAGSQAGAVKNRRSTLLGEKGFGLGVCGRWQFFEDVAGRSV